jgi:hypothetical protein
MKLRISYLTIPESYTTNLLNSSKHIVLKLPSDSDSLIILARFSFEILEVLTSILISLVKSDVIVT